MTDFQALERTAAAGADMEPGWKLEDIAAFEALRWLYTTHRLGKISTEKATEEKRRIKAEWRKRSEAREWDSKLVRYHVRLAKDGAKVRADYRKSRTLENADAMLAFLEGEAFDPED